MREILFRGKKDNGEWVEGNYGFFKSTNGKEKLCHITTEEGRAIRVDGNTVGQYTGLTDKNGKKIFEGDILKIDGSIYCVKFHNGTFGVVVKNGGYAGAIPKVANYVQDFVEIIGNIYDNPELWAGENNG